MTRFRITVPAAIDGLGPGSGIVGLALTLTDTVEAEVDAESEEITGSEPLCNAYRSWPAERLPGARFTFEPGIPKGNDLGGPTARVVAGLAAAVAATETLDARQEVFRLALEQGACSTQLAACVMGGLVTTHPRGESLDAIHVVDHLTMDIVLYLPEQPLPISPSAPDPSRLAYLLTALMWGRWDWIARVMEPEKVPESIAAVLSAAREAGALGATLTGSSLVALAPLHQGEQVVGAMRDRAGEEGIPGHGIVTGVRAGGIEIKKL